MLERILFYLAESYIVRAVLCSCMAAIGAENSVVSFPFISKNVWLIDIMILVYWSLEYRKYRRRASPDVGKLDAKVS